MTKGRTNALSPRLCSVLPYLEWWRLAEAVGPARVGSNAEPLISGRAALNGTER
jgi:hypothetical protein